MKGLPRMQDSTRPRDAWMVAVCGGVESLTHSLRRGDAYTEKALDDLIALRRRLDAFGAALDYRLSVLNEEREEAE